MKSWKIPVAALLLLAASLGIGGTLAYLTDTTDQIVNTFVAGTVPPSIEESFDGKTKENVRIKNNGNISAFIRACVVINWKDAQGNLLPRRPVLGTDYSIQWAESGWQKHGDYYYCLTPVKPGALTPILIREVVQKEKKEGYDLVVEIVSQTIQSDGVDNSGKTPVEIAWNVIIENGTLRTAAAGEDTP